MNFPPTLKIRRMNGITFTESSGNIWADAGFLDAEERHAKSLFSIAIRQHINALGLTQAEVAHRLGIDPPHMSEIWNNLVDGYSIDNLSDILKRIEANLKIPS